MKKSLIAAAALLLVPHVASAQSPIDGALPGTFRVDTSDLAPPSAPLPRIDLTIEDSDGLSHVIHAEVAVDPQAQAYGLMNRHSMPRDAGMLFWFGDSQPRWFWMKDTLIPLDMLFIGADGTINHIHANAQPLDEKAVPSEGPAVAVLELNGGAAAGMGIREGDRVFDAAYFKNLPAPAQAVP